MDKDFLQYNEALEIRQLGFDEPCLKVSKHNKLCKHQQLGVCQLHNLHCKYPDCTMDKEGPPVELPTYQQAFRFFRVKYGYNCFITSSVLDGKWFYFRENLNDRRDDSEPELTPKFDTFEEAQLACIERLIQIVKNR